MAKNKKAEASWATKALTKKTAALMDDQQFNKALDMIDHTQESAGMKHLLVNWAADERLEGRKLPDKLLSRKKTSSFKESVKRYMLEDRGTFRLSGVTAAFSMVLLCSFIRNALFNSYLVNFSVDALVGTVGGVLALLNLKTQFNVTAFYGSTTNMMWTDILSVVLWFMLVWAFRQFDLSILVFLVTYIFNYVRFKKMQKKFIEENHLEIDLGSK